MSAYVQLPARWTPLRHHPKQDALYRERRRFVNVVAGRGSGKTEVARRRLVRYLPVVKPWPDPLYFYAAPTREQAKRLAWEQLKALIPPEWVSATSESELTIKTVFGSKVIILGLDKPERAEGVQYDGGVIDESSDVKPGTFALSLGPAMTHRYPWCWRIGVPKRAGAGAREFKEAFDLGMSGREPESTSYWWPSSDILSPDQLRFHADNLDEKDFNEQYRASWETAGGLVFYAYDEVQNDSAWVYNPELPLLIGSDFNVDPMCWVIAQQHGGKLHVFDELFIRSTNTQATLDALHKKYEHHAAGWRFYGDASGRARHSSASQSDYLIIKSDSRFRGARVFYPLANPPVADRFASCNRAFKTAAGTRTLFVHGRCKHLKRDLQARAYAEGCNEPDDHDDVGHITDALGYLVHTLHPVSAPLGGGSSGGGIATGVQ